MRNDIIEELYRVKEINYFSLEREIFKNAVSENNLKILDIGCGSGVLGAYYKKNQNCKVYGIEISQNAYKLAVECLDEVAKGNVESMNLHYEDDFFDVMIMGDVLEHLINPIDTIKRLLPFLKPGGKIHITVPNVKHWSVVYSLIVKDEWEYKDWGILDYTHMKFFTKKSFVKLLGKLPNVRVEKSDRIIQKPSKSYFIDKLTLGLFSGFLASHTFVTLEKN